jgi:hypothetical protein
MPENVPLSTLFRFHYYSESILRLAQNVEIGIHRCPHDFHIRNNPGSKKETCAKPNHPKGELSRFEPRR